MTATISGVTTGYTCPQREPVLRVPPPIRTFSPSYIAGKSPLNWLMLMQKMFTPFLSNIWLEKTLTNAEFPRINYSTEVSIELLINTTSMEIGIYRQTFLCLEYDILFSLFISCLKLTIRFECYLV